MGGCAENGSGRDRSGAAGAENGSGREWSGERREERDEELVLQGRESADAGSDHPEWLDAESREAEARTERTSRVSRLHAEITAATREFLRAVLECDRHRDWEAAGFGSCAEWLGWLLGIQRNAANERVRVAKALEQLPLTSESMAHGEISAERYQVVLHVDAETLTETEAPGRSELEDGTRVSAETARRVACDTGLVVMAHGG